jgi:hypothetical protein
MDGLTDNRLTRAIREARAKLNQLDDAARAKVDAGMDVSASEHFDYQQAQAIAHASGKLTTDEAQVIYAALGEYRHDGNGGWTPGTDTATKYVCTKAIGELLSARLRERAA